MKTTCPAMLFGPRVYPKYLHESGYLAQMVQCLLHGFVLTAQHIDKEHVFPGLAPDWPGLDLAQIQVTQGKDAKRLEQRAGNVSERKDQRGLIGPVVNFLLLLNQEKAGKV